MDEVPAPATDSAIVEALRQAVERIGSQSALAQLVGVAQPTVWRWLKGQRIAAEHVLAVEDATGISRHDLRPDLPLREDAPARLTRLRRSMEPAR